eukprot:CAMPEP_0117512202 /NCGR_PEP_ID=MMETSP0784-20121206/28910_1 /TAXON_ID=39447 /ORGANISM="" /LENGTH=85 /DNA_ID=CAMNT_0005307915 /DNA_START=382 /DNA_END=639 /DNA_ORIENTATION=+
MMVEVPIANGDQVWRRPGSQKQPNNVGVGTPAGNAQRRRTIPADVVCVRPALQKHAAHLCGVSVGGPNNRSPTSLIKFIHVRSPS